MISRRAHPDRSLPFLSFNLNKRGVTLNARDPADRERIRSLLASADLVVESDPVDAWHELGLGYEDLLEENPRLVWVSVTHFGRKRKFETVIPADAG